MHHHHNDNRPLEIDPHELWELRARAEGEALRQKELAIDSRREELRKTLFLKLPALLLKEARQLPARGTDFNGIRVDVPLFSVEKGRECSESEELQLEAARRECHEHKSSLLQLEVLSRADKKIEYNDGAEDDWGNRSSIAYDVPVILYFVRATVSKPNAPRSG